MTWWGSISLLRRERNPSVLVSPQEEAISALKSRGSPEVTIPKDPDVPIHSRYIWFPCTDSTVTPSIDSKHDGTCDSPVAPWEKPTDPYVNSTGSLTLLLQLERKADLHVSTGDEAWLPCWNYIGTPRSMSALERNPEVLGSSWWIQGNSKGRWNRSSKKKLFNWKYKERLEKNSAVGKLVEKRGWKTWFTWKTNKTPRKGICTIYVGHRHPLE